MYVAGLLGSLVIIAAPSAEQFPVRPPAVTAEPNLRMRQLRNDEEFESIRVVEEEWLRMWLTDQPSHLHPQRIRGGIQ